MIWYQIMSEPWASWILMVRWLGWWTWPNKYLAILYIFFLFFSRARYFEFSTLFCTWCQDHFTDPKNLPLQKYLTFLLRYHNRFLLCHLKWQPCFFSKIPFRPWPRKIPLIFLMALFCTDWRYTVRLI